jgi:hypothetical protein
MFLLLFIGATRSLQYVQSELATFYAPHLVESENRLATTMATAQKKLKKRRNPKKNVVMEVM